MTTSDATKVLKQLERKPAKHTKYKKHNLPKKRKHGVSTKKCGRCGRVRGHIAKYGLNLCRQCFRQTALKLGFKKYS